jgi:hypothetical protein
MCLGKGITGRLSGSGRQSPAGDSLGCEDVVVEHLLHDGNGYAGMCCPVINGRLKDLFSGCIRRSADIEETVLVPFYGCKDVRQRLGAHVQDSCDKDVCASDEGVKVPIQRIGMNLLDDGLNLVLCALLAEERRELTTLGGKGEVFEILA